MIKGRAINIMALNAVQKEEARERRGEIGNKDLSEYQELNDSQLLDLLNNKENKQRTIAATLLGYRRSTLAINQLCQALQVEKALYVRLAISEALYRIGEPAITPLCNLLGRIGRNQENVLPSRSCEKKSYPLVRDLAGRILTKIGVKAIPSLIEILYNGKQFQIEQAIDSLGAIAYWTGDLSALQSIFQLMEKVSDNDFMIWKITRSLGGFRSVEAVKKLITILNQSVQPALRWEAARSIGQIAIYDDLIMIELNNALKDPDYRVRNAASKAKNHLNSMIKP